ncbi:MAG: CpaF family protein [Acidimicrobiia bacterium]|nr:CpaF family protein [Acidimicrobiia bacterium]
MSAVVIDAVHTRLLADWSSGDRHGGGTPDLVRALVRDAAPLLPAAEEAAVVAAVLARVQGLGPLDPLLSDPTVTEVMVNGGGRVWIERDGELTDTGIVIDEATALRLIERVVAPLGLRIDRSSPMVDARLPDGSRVNAVVRPLAIDGPCLTIRRFGSRAVPLDAFADPAVASLLRQAVAERRNVVVSGGTGAGKTTLLNALAAEIPSTERVVTIEDAAELRLPGVHVVRLEARPPNADGVGAVSIRDLVRNALRMRPDRIVVGEVRGPEALDMLQAMNTGHEGSLSTCHANSTDDALRRLETLSLLAGLELPLAAVREQLVSAVDVVVQVARRGAGARRIVAVGEPDAGPGGGRCRSIAEGDRVISPFARPPRVEVDPADTARGES